MQLHRYGSDISRFDKFRIDCTRCCGLCCVALYFSKFDGFPADKEAGTPCRYLDPDFRCSIHNDFIGTNMKGCRAYECAGAGQLVTALYAGQNWQSDPHIAQEMCDVFVKVHLLQQASWYLLEILTLPAASPLYEETQAHIGQLAALMQSGPTEILNFNMDEFMKPVTPLLKSAGELVRKQIKTSDNAAKKKDYMGYNFKKANLDGRDFSTALLIAANLKGCSLAGCSFLGADLRDSNLRDADLSESIFLTQGQINAAAGNQNTRIPSHLDRPRMWG